MTTTIPPIEAIKARQKAACESGDFGQVVKTTLPVAEEFMARLPLRPGMRVLDVACGSGNLAVIAAKRGCVVKGVDIAANHIAQARERATSERLDIEFLEGDAEALPYGDGGFDAVDFFRRYHGPTGKAFDALGPDAQSALHLDLVELQTAHNSPFAPGTTQARAEYLEVLATTG